MSFHIAATVISSKGQAGEHTVDWTTELCRHEESTDRLVPLLEKQVSAGDENVTHAFQGENDLREKKLMSVVPWRTGRRNSNVRSKEREGKRKRGGKRLKLTSDTVTVFPFRCSTYATQSFNTYVKARISHPTLSHRLTRYRTREKGAGGQCEQMPKFEKHTSRNLTHKASLTSS